MRSTRSTRTGALDARVFIMTAPLFSAAAAGCAVVTTDEPPGGLREAHAAPPDAPESADAADGPGAVFAISSVRLGENDPGGAPDKEAYRTIGYDLDGVITGQGGEATCAPAKGAPAGALTDGDDGRDNAFGKSLLPLINALAKTAEARTNTDLSLGRPTVLFHLRGLGDAAEYNGLTGAVYGGAQLTDETGAAIAPAFDGGDIWPIAPEPMKPDGGPKPLAPIEDAYLTADSAGGTWVGRSPGVMTLRVAMSEGFDPDKALRLEVHQPWIALHFTEDRTRATGTLAGLLYPEELLPEVRRVVALYNPGFCDILPEDGVTLQITQSADIRRDGAVDPSAPCDAISIGIELQAGLIQLGAVAPPAAPPADPCSF